MTMRTLAPMLAIGVTGIALGIVQVAVDPKRALFAYLAAFLVALTIALGALLFVMVTEVARARWFVVFRRLALAIASTLPLFLVLFVPIALFVPVLYPWAGPIDAMTAPQQAWVHHVGPWLNVPFFVARAYVYLAAWSVIAILLRRAEIANDARPRESLVRRARLLCALGLPVMALTLIFASFDWLMSLNTRWSSDILGLYVFAGALAGAIGVLTIAAWLAARAQLLPREVGPAHFHALGRVLLVSVIFWAYIAFCQFLLVWIADLERESSFFAARSEGAWVWVSVALGVAHFAVPFLLLLSRRAKRIPGRLALVGGWLVCAHALDVYWMVLPPLHSGVRVLDLAFVFGLGGLITAFGLFRFFGARPIPIHDPSLAESLRYESP